MRFFRVPRERVVDAVPIALVLILFSSIAVVPLVVPVCMLHLWLWLRHPRSRSRYLIFACVSGLVLGLGAALPLIGNLIYSHTSGGDALLVHVGHVPMMLMVFSAAGILPILYRLVSRCSLTSRRELASDAASVDAHSDSQSRAGISDLLALSTMCAIVFVVAGASRESYRWYHAPIWDLAITLMYSLVGLIAMRINAQCSRSMMFANFLFIWVGGTIAIRLLVHVMGLLQQTWFEEASWFNVLYRRELERETSVFAMIFVALFPVVCRRCGVILTLPSLSDSAGDQHGNANTDQSTGAETGVLPRSRGQRILGASGQLFGGTALVVMLSAIMLYPYTQVVGYLHGDDLGYRIGGWPFEYWVVKQIEATEAAWYWTKPGIWQTVQFRMLPLLIDIALVAITFLLVFPIPWVQRTFRCRGVRIGRYALGLFLLAMFVYSIGGAAIWRQYRYASIPGVTVRDYDEHPKLGLFESIAFEIDTSWRGTSDRIKRGLPSDVIFDSASSEVIEEIISDCPIRYVEFIDCDITAQNFERLANIENLSSVEFSNCNLPSGAVETLVAQRRIYRIHFDEGTESRTYRWRGYSRHRTRPWAQRSLYDLKLVSKGGEYRTGENVQSLELVVPNHVDSRFTFADCENLTEVVAQNTVGVVPDSVCELSFSSTPELTGMRLDNYQKFAVTLADAPRLRSVTGFFDKVAFHEARLVSLKIVGENNLQNVFVDVSECENLELGTPRDRSVGGTLRLSSYSGIRSQPPEVLSASESRDRLALVKSMATTYELVLRGFTLNASTLDLLPTPIDSLNLDGCVLVGEDEASLRQRWPAVVEVNVNDAASSNNSESQGETNE